MFWCSVIPPAAVSAIEFCLGPGGSRPALTASVVRLGVAAHSTGSFESQ